MVAEIVDWAANSVQVAGDVASIANTTTSLAIAAGTVTGYLTPDAKHAALFSALAGAAIPIALGKGSASFEKIAFSTATSTAIGLLVNYLKTTFAEREAQKKEMTDFTKKPQL